MGWASGSYVFDDIMGELKFLNPETKKRVAVKIIHVFRDMDWDTEDESLETFKDDPAIVAAFREACPRMFETYPGEEPPECASYNWKYHVLCESLWYTLALSSP